MRNADSAPLRSDAAPGGGGHARHRLFLAPPRVGRALHYQQRRHVVIILVLPQVLQPEDDLDAPGLVP